PATGEGKVWPLAGLEAQNILVEFRRCPPILGEDGEVVHFLDWHRGVLSCWPWHGGIAPLAENGTTGRSWVGAAAPAHHCHVHASIHSALPRDDCDCLIFCSQPERCLSSAPAHARPRRANLPRGLRAPLMQPVGAAAAPAGSALGPDSLPAHARLTPPERFARKGPEIAAGPRPAWSTCQSRPRDASAQPHARPCRQGAPSRAGWRCHIPPPPGPGPRWGRRSRVARWL